MTTVDKDDHSEEDDHESSSEDEDSEEEHEEAEDPTSNHEKLEVKKRDDVEEGKTLFIRNLAFDTTQETLKSYFEDMGELEYALVCKDKQTEHSKGSAFVKFVSKDSATSVIQMQKEDPHSLTLDGRRLIIDYAIDKQNLGQRLQEQQQTKKDRDKRNLYLAREGMIYAGSPAAEGVSPEDLKKRLEIEMRKRKALQLSTNFVSKTRVCVHNIPDFYDDKELRKLFLSHVKDRNVVITEARIMRNKSADGKLKKSKGFGFVEFKEHEHALTAVRNLNNNPDIFSNTRRPIIEFAVEDRMKLNAKKTRMDRAEKLRKEKLNPNVNLIPVANKQPSVTSLDSIQPQTKKERAFLKTIKKFKARRIKKREAKLASGESTPSVPPPATSKTQQNNTNVSKNKKKKDKRLEKEKSTTFKKESIVDKKDTGLFSGIKAEPIKADQKVVPLKINRKITESRKIIQEKAKEIRKQSLQEKTKELHDRKRLQKNQRKKEVNIVRKEKEAKVKDFDDYEESFLKKRPAKMFDADDSTKIVAKKKKWFANEGIQ